MSEPKRAIRKIGGKSEFITELEKNPACSDTGRVHAYNSYQEVHFADKLKLEIPRRAEDLSSGFWFIINPYDYVEGYWFPVDNVEEARDYMMYTLMEDPGLLEEEIYGLTLILAMM